MNVALAPSTVKPAPFAAAAFAAPLATVMLISSTSKVVELIVVVVPSTCKLPVTVKSPPTDALFVTDKLASVDKPVTPSVELRVTASVTLSVELTSTEPPTENTCVALSHAKLASSCNAPLVPASTTRPLVRSLTVALASVASPVTPKVPPTVALPAVKVRLPAADT